MTSNWTALGIVALFSTACATTPITSDLPRNRASAKLDAKFLAHEPVPGATLKTYRKVLTRSDGFFENLRLMPVTPGFIKLQISKWESEEGRKLGLERPAIEAKIQKRVAQRLKKEVTGKTCFRFEHDTRDFDASERRYWEARLLDAKGQKHGMEMKFDTVYVSNQANNSYQFSGQVCTSSKVPVKGAKVVLVPRYQKKPSPYKMEWL